MSAAHLGAVALVVPDYDAAIFFFVGVMGFRLTADIDQGTQALGHGGAARRRCAACAGTGRGTRHSARPSATRPAGRVFLFLETDDFARDHARMTAAGILFEEEPRHEPYGTVAVWRDPFGNRWDLIERPE